MGFLCGTDKRYIGMQQVPLVWNEDIDCNIVVSGKVSSNSGMVRGKWKNFVGIRVCDYGIFLIFIFILFFLPVLCRNAITNKTLNSYDKLCSMEINMSKSSLRPICVISTVRVSSMVKGNHLM